MDSFSPGNGLPLDSLTNGGIDDIIRESSDDIDAIVTQWEPLGQRKQALERRLQTRRDPLTLQSHGILPPPKTPPNYYAESQRLERCKTKDYLKNKILQRPDRQTLIQYHILEEANVSPALANCQKNLQRAQLADQLNMKISHRPGPIELIQRNILEADDDIKEAVLNGKVQYQPVNEEDQLGHYSSEDSPPGSVKSIHSPASCETIKIDQDLICTPHEIQHTMRPPSRSDHRRSNSAIRLKKKNNRSKFKFHVYTPSDKSNDRRKESVKIIKNENYENRMNQQKLLLDVSTKFHKINEKF
jgi:hypothetical protein